MIGVRGRKILRDVLGRPGRSLLAVLAMAAGLFEITVMLDSYALLEPELHGMYARTRPSAATITTDAVDDEVMATVRGVTGVGEAEARPMVLARTRTASGEWIPVALYVVRDFDRLSMDTFRREHGAAPPGPGEVLIERSGMEFSGSVVGRPISLRMPGREDSELLVTGTVHAEGLAPSWMEHMLVGFVGWDSRARDPGGIESAQLRIRVAEHDLDEGHIRDVAESVRSTLEAAGHPVARVLVPAPGKHPHADQMSAFLFLLLSFGLLSFLLSAVLLASLVQSWMAEEIRILGVLQAIGASRRQVQELYLGLVGVLSAAALVLGLPAGFLAGHAYARFSARILNADVASRPFPWLVLAGVAIAGFAIPLLVAYAPVRAATRRTVRESLADESGFDATGARVVDGWLSRLPGISRPLALTLRTTLLRRARLVLTVTLLAIGGASFLSALNVADAWRRAVDDDFSRRRWDLTVPLTESQSVAKLDEILSRVPEVEHVEYWPGISAYLVGPDGASGNAIAVVGVEPSSELLALRLVSGRGLRPDDRNGAVVHRAILDRLPGLAVGDSVAVRYAGRTLRFPVIGIFRELTPMPVVYVARPAVLEALGQDGTTTRMARIVTRRHGAEDQRAAAEAVEAALGGAGIGVGNVQRMEDVRASIQDHLVIILAVLGMSSIVVLAVGALGLASTLTLDVVRRTREIGILGAIGATPATIAGLVWVESLTLGLLSWVVSLVVAAPITLALERAAGSIFLRNPLDFSMSPTAALIWLGVVVAISTLCSLYPAARAARLPVREALAHV